MDDVNNEEVDGLLEEFFPDFGDRSRAREFSKLNPEQRALWLYASINGIQDRLTSGGDRLDSMESCIARIAARSKARVSPHIIQALYTTAAAASVVYALATGRIPG